MRYGNWPIYVLHELGHGTSKESRERINWSGDILKLALCYDDSSFCHQGEGRPPMQHVGLTTKTNGHDDS